MNDSEKDCQKRELNAAIEEIVDRDNPHAYSMIVIVELNIRRYGLSGCYEPAEILTMAYLRGLKATDQGTRIQNYRSWIKGTAFNIVRELARQKAKEIATDPQAARLERASEPDGYGDNDNRKLAILMQAFEKYRSDHSEDAELMEWRILEKLSWSKIQQRLLDRNGKAPSLEALRQRARRAKRDIRRIFHELGGEFTPLR